VVARKQSYNGAGMTEGRNDSYASLALRPRRECFAVAA